MRFTPIDLQDIKPGQIGDKIKTTIDNALGGGGAWKKLKDGELNFSDSKDEL